MTLRKISKGIAGALATAAGGAGTAYVMVPEGVDMPWYGYVVVTAINAAIGFLVVYRAPKNAP